MHIISYHHHHLHEPMSHHHTYYVTSSYLPCHIIITICMTINDMIIIIDYRHHTHTPSVLKRAMTWWQKTVYRQINPICLPVDRSHLSDCIHVLHVSMHVYIYIHTYIHGVGIRKIREIHGPHAFAIWSYGMLTFEKYHPRVDIQLTVPGSRPANAILYVYVFIISWYIYVHILYCMYIYHICIIYMLYTYVYIYVCMYIYIYTYMYVCIHTYIYSSPCHACDLHMLSCRYMCVRIHMCYVYMCMCVLIFYECACCVCKDICR